VKRGFFPGCGQIEQQAKEKKEIEALFERYRNALLDFYGEEAVKLVCSQTIEWYDQIVDDALYLEAVTLKQADIMKKFTVLRVRLEFSKDQLEKMDGKALFDAAIDNGWIDLDTVEKIRLHRIKIRGDRAEAYVKGSPGTPAFHFIKERGQWKLALIKSFALARKTFEAMISSSGMDEDRWLASAFSQLVKKEVDIKKLYVPLAGTRGSGTGSKKISSSIATSVESIISIGEIGIRDQVLYRITIRAGKRPGKLELKGLDDFTVMDTSWTVGVSPIGDKVVSFSYFDYYLSPRRMGMLTIPAQVILVEGKEYKTREHRVEVLSGSLKAAREALQRMKNSFFGE
jgi:hypothetical protein